MNHVDDSSLDMPDLLDVYEGEITIRLERLPGLQPVVLPTRSESVWRRFIDAGRRRRFTLVRDFEIEVQGSALADRLQGCIVVPVGETPEPNIFDGASIPLPWIVSYLSFGVLRPLGILLAASVVHDFAFQFGYLMLRRQGTLERVDIERHEADELFRLITSTLNRSWVFSRLAWHAVRLGWWFIPYAGRSRGGEPPVRSTLFAVLVLVATVVVCRVLAQLWLPSMSGWPLIAALLGFLVSLMAAVYAWIGLEKAFLIGHRRVD